MRDLCIKILWDNLYKICVSGSLYEDTFGPLVSGSCRTTCTRSLYQGPLDRLCQDPLGPLVQDLCIRILLNHCIGILLDHCIRILLDNLCKICVSGSLCECEDPLDHLYQDPAVALVQDPCYQDTCARSLYQDPVGSLLSGSCRTTSARSLSQDLCVRIQFWATCITRYCKRANSARLPRKLKIRTSKTSVLCETSSKTEDPDFQNERFVRDFLEN